MKNKLGNLATFSLPQFAVAANPSCSPAVGKTLADINLRAITGATVIALKHADGSGVSMPTGHDELEVGDVLSVSGTREAIAAARAMLTGEPAPAAVAPDEAE